MRGNVETLHSAGSLTPISRPDETFPFCALSTFL